LQVAWFLYLVCLPISICLWAILLVGVGAVNSVERMPWELQLAARIAVDGKYEGPSWTVVPAAICFLVFANLPVPLIVLGPYGLDGSIAAVLYVLVEAAWLVRVRRAIREARPR
jgi:hypothetical protein